MDKAAILKYVKNAWAQADEGLSGFTTDFSKRTDRYKNNRKYSEGLHDVDKFKQQLSVDGDSTHLNLDWGVSTPLPKLAEVIRGQMLNQPHKIQFIPTDSVSLSALDKERRMLRAKRLQKKILGDIENAGVDIGAGDIPLDDDEFKIYESMNHKLSYSAAMEAISKSVLIDNDIDVVDELRAKDLVDLKIEVVRVDTDENNRIKIRRVDPARFVSSYVTKDDFSDAKHMGELIDISIEDLRVQATDLTEEDLFSIAKSCANRYGNPNFPYDKMYNVDSVNPEEYNSFIVKVLDFEFFGETDILFQKMEAKNGGFYFQKKPSDYDPPKNPKRKRDLIKKRVKNVYKCKYIIGTSHIYEYGLKKFMVRDRINSKYSTNTKLGFIVNAPDIFEMENKSKVEEMIPYADELIRIQLKLQQIISKAAPSGYAIDIDAVIGALGMMGLDNPTPLSARSIRDQIGDIYFRSVTDDGRPITNTAPVRDLPNGLDQTIDRLTYAYNAALSRMKEAIGMNDAVDSSQPSKDSLVGVQKLSLAAHKNALRKLYHSYLRTKERVVSHVTNIAQQQIRKGVNKKMYELMIGSEAVKIIDATKLSTAEFAIQIKMLPDEEERAYIEEQLKVAQANGVLSPSDIFTIRRVAKEDIDRAEQLLAIRESKRRKEKMQESMMLQEQNAKVQSEAAVNAEQAKQQTLQVKAQSSMQELQLKYDLELRNQRELEEEKRKTEAVIQDYKIEIIKEAAKTKQSENRSESYNSNKGYDLQKDSMPKEAGDIEPDVMPSEFSEV